MLIIVTIIDMTTLSGRLIALKARNRTLEAEARELARRTSAQQAERRRSERDLHDCVQNELVSLLVKLRQIERERDSRSRWPACSHP